MEKRVSFINILALVVMISSFIVELVVYFNSVKDGNGLSTQIITSCIAIQVLVLGYYYGSSKSSASKDATIQSMQENISNPQPVIKTDVVNTDNIETVNTQTLNDTNNK